MVNPDSPLSRPPELNLNEPVLQEAAASQEAETKALAQTHENQLFEATYAYLTETRKLKESQVSLQEYLKTCGELNGSARTSTLLAAQGNPRIMELFLKRLK